MKIVNGFRGYSRNGYVSFAVKPWNRLDCFHHFYLGEGDLRVLDWIRRNAKNNADPWDTLFRLASPSLRRLIVKRFVEIHARYAGERKRYSLQRPEAPDIDAFVCRKAFWKEVGKLAVLNAIE